MKKLLLIPFVLIGFSVIAQQSATFKIKYLPNHSYDGAMSLNAVCKVNLTGPDSIISKITAKGLTLPIGVNADLKMHLSTKTGAAGSDQSIPASMKITFDDLGVELNGNQLPIPMDKFQQGISVSGRFDKDGAFDSDSTGGKAIADSVKAKMKQMTSGIQKKIKFPDHPMKIGESFTQGQPFDLPMKGTDLKVDAKTVYTLIKIENGNAYFDAVPSLDIRVPVKGKEIIITGSGKGTMVYSIKDNFATDFNTTFNLKLNGDIDKVQVDATVDLQLGFKYTIVAQ